MLKNVDKLVRLIQTGGDDVDLDWFKSRALSEAMNHCMNEANEDSLRTIFGFMFTKNAQRRKSALAWLEKQLCGKNKIPGCVTDVLISVDTPIFNLADAIKKGEYRAAEQILSSILYSPHQSGR